MAAQVGTNLLYIGGSDGTAATATTYVAKVDKGNFGAWAEGPALPAARTDAALAILSGTAYLVGGLGPDGKPTDTVWSIGLDPDTSELTPWSARSSVRRRRPDTARAPASGAAAVAVADGIVVAGGRGRRRQADGHRLEVDDRLEGRARRSSRSSRACRIPSRTPRIAFEGTYLWVYGGSDETGAIGLRPARATTAPPPRPDRRRSPGDAGRRRAAPEVVAQVGHPGRREPARGRTGAAGFSANGALYLVGGSDGKTLARELYWALPGLDGQPPRRLAPPRRDGPARRPRRRARRS